MLPKFYVATPWKAVPIFWNLVVLALPMEGKMRYRKVERILERLKEDGFDMTTNEFIETSVYRILKRHGINVQLDTEEYFELLRRLMDICAENDLKNMGMSYLNDDDLKFK